MTARPNFLKKRRRPVCVVVSLMLVMVAVLLAAGCIGCFLLPTGCIESNYITDEDIVAIKLNSYGSTAWMKTIDSGKSELIKKIIQTSDEGYALAGSYSTPLCHNPGPVTPTVIRLSDSGEFLWRKDYDLGFGGLPPYSPDQIAGIVQSPESGYYLVSSYGVLIKLDSQGYSVWRKNLSIEWSENLFVDSLLQNPDGSIVLGGRTWNCTINPQFSWCNPGTIEAEPFITKLDPLGNQVSATKIPNPTSSKVRSIVKFPDDAGYIVHVPADGSMLFGVDESGQLVNSRSINSIRDVYQINSNPDGFSIFSVNQSIHWNSMNRTFIESSYTNEGNLTKTTNLLNITQRDAPSDRDKTIVTSNGNLFSINLIVLISDNIPRGVNVHAQEVNRDDERIWDRNITSYKIDPDLVHIREIIETKDNGFLVVLGVEKQKEC